MHFIDILFIVPILWGAWKGFSKGFVIEVATLVALLLGVWGGINFSDMVADWLIGSFEFDEKYLPIVAFALTFLIILAAVFAVGKLVEKMVETAGIGIINKIAGGAFGLAKVALIISVILVIVNSYNDRLGFIPDDVKEQSLLYQPMTDMALTVIPALENSKMYQDVKDVSGFGTDSVPEQVAPADSLLVP